MTDGTYEIKVKGAHIMIDGGIGWHSTTIVMEDNDDWVKAQLDDNQLKLLTMVLMEFCTLRGVSLDDTQADEVQS